MQYVKHAASHCKVAQSQSACHVRKSTSQLELMHLTKETRESLEVDLILVSPVPGHPPALQMSDWTVDNSSKTNNRHTCICSGHWVTQVQPGLTDGLMGNTNYCAENQQGREKRKHPGKATTQSHTQHHYKAVHVEQISV